MRTQTRMISAVILVVAVLNVVYTVYFVKRERRQEMVQLLAVMEENDALLKVVTAGPLYDGNVEQLGAILDSIFAHRDIMRIELTEYNGNIKMFRSRAPTGKMSESLTRRIIITRGIDQLGEIQTIYSTAHIERAFMTSIKRSSLFALVMLLVLSGVIYLVVRGITGPIEHLTVTARAVAEGNLNQEISASGTQELQSLGQSFLRMRDAIREKMTDLAAQNEALLRTQFSIDRAKDAVFWVRQNGYFVYVNQDACNSLGYTREELLSLAVFDIDPQYPREQWLAQWEKARNRGSSIIETIHCAKDGRLFPVELSIDFMSFAGEEYLCAFARDVTERKRIEKTLRDSRNLLQAVLDTIPARIFWKDLNLRYLGCNRPFALDAGVHSPEEMIGKDDYQMGWREQADLYRSDDRQVLETGKPKIQYEEPQTTPDGRRVWLRTSKVPLRNAEGTIWGLLGTYDDITEHKRAEEERISLEAQLAQAQKMESVGRLAGGVAHDFNNMLSVILGYAELIKQGLPEGHPLLKDADEIQRAAVRSRDITRQLLAFSRQQIIAPRPADLNDLVTDTQKTLARLIGEDIELCFFPGKDLWTIRFDPSQFDQILINLAVNARDAMPEGGKLTIETSNVHLDDAYCRDHAGFIPGDHVQLVVSDNGMGMDRETLSHVFEPFFTTKGVDKGTGLGLATVYGIVRQNNAFINVYSEPRQGTTFRIYFPRIRVKEGKITERDKEAKAASGIGTILLVEDDEMVRSVATALLQKIGYTVLVARNPMEALTLLEKVNTPVDLLLTDVVMPGMNGAELRDRACVVRPGIKVLFMSGYTTNVIVHHGILEEGVHFVQKPFSLEILAEKVREAMQG